jgi:hypothetical protein
MTALDAWSLTPVLTHSPMQRAGALALAMLADLDTVEELDPGEFKLAVEVMTEDLRETALRPNAKDPGAGVFWLKASYLLWPNSAVNATARGKQSIAVRREQIARWRTPPDTTAWPGVPCALCGRPACGFYGKVDVPLGASVSHRNTTPRGHQGMALCWGCLCSLWALPYACRIEGGRAALVHSWDDEVLAHAVRDQVHSTRQAVITGGVRPVPGAYVRYRLALTRLRAYTPDQDVRADIDLLVFTNNNQDQDLEIHHLSQPAATWLRRTAWSPALDQGYRFLARALRNKKVSGHHLLAKILFDNPAQLPAMIASYLDSALPAEADTIPVESAALAPLCTSYITEVLAVPTTDVASLRELASNIADVLTATNRVQPVKNFRQARRRSATLRRWLEETSYTWMITQAADPKDAAADDAPTGDGVRASRREFVTDDQLALLFSPDPDVPTWLHQSQLYVGVLAEMQRRGWRIDSAEARAALDEIDDSDDTAFDETTAEEDNR